FLGFICGMLSQNFDISVNFVDAFLKLVKCDVEKTEELFARLEALTTAHNVQVIISCSVDDEAAPEFMKKYFI
ncbi:MAG: twitching motility protein PilT, partial [Clostridia bacterium]|nr:twitching motility protein PilT [Clostridia bacterium]